MSVQAAFQTVNALISGLDHIKEEIELLKHIKPPLSNDRFIQVMEVCVTMMSFIASRLTSSLALLCGNGTQGRCLEEHEQRRRK